ncbi:MAG: glycerol-3-phosphate acyltransferase, partial [Gemmatimonadales bacterium]|nr:glycerol-3-phosphate acyltransferase [Candidatus Palauibacter irciniicola]
LAYGLAAISGHVWPVYTKFKGGKGVATAAGTMAALVPVAVIVAFSVWVVTVVLTRTASMASLLSAALVPIMARGSAAPRSVVFYALLLAITVWWTHRSNLVRIVRREEFQVDWRRGRLPRRERTARKPPEDEA